MAHPLELSYNWRTPAMFATIGAFICLSVLIHGRVAGWLAAALVVVLLWAAFVGVLYLRTQAYLLIDRDRPTLFAWILAEAPQTELDNGSQRTVERLQSKGLLP